MDVVEHGVDAKASEYQVNHVAVERANSTPSTPEVELRRKVGKERPKKSKNTPRYDLDEDPAMFYDGKSGIRWYDKILLDRRLRFAIVFILFAVVTPLVVYATVFTAEKTTDPYNIPGTCILKPEFRVPCVPGESINKQQCSNVGCCWNKTTTECYHSAPSSYQYLIQNSSPGMDTDPEINLDLKPRLGRTAFGSDAIQSLKVKIQALADDHLQIVIKDSKQSGEVAATTSLQQSQFNVTVFKPGFFLEVVRRDGTKGEHLLMSTSHGPLIASDNYWEISLQMPLKAQVFGLGQLHLSSDDNNNPRALYNHPRNTGSHPVIICVDAQGRAHGLYLENKGPLETHFNKDSNLLIVRSIATEGFNIHVFAGPTPRDVMTQLTGLVGRPVLPPYWGLGLHVCRDKAGTMPTPENVLVLYNVHGLSLWLELADKGQKGITLWKAYYIDNSSDGTNVTNIVEGWNNFSTAAEEMKLPYDSHCLHEELLGNLTIRVAVEDESTIKGALADLWRGGRRFMLSLPSALQVSEDSPAYTAAVEESVLIQLSRTNSSPYEGEFGDMAVGYPDWSQAGAQPWLAVQLKALEQQLQFGEPGVFGGVVLLDNWPADALDHAAETLPYIPQAMNGSLSNGTVWWQAAHGDGSLHYMVHNKYGLEQSRAIKASFTAGDGLLLLSASTSVGSGSVAGSHHQGVAHVPAMWTSLKDTLTSALGAGLVGLPLASGGPVCGNMDDYNPKEHEPLCLKWYLLATTLPLIRVSSVYPYRDPPSLFSGYARQAVLRALQLRYSLLPYYYTLFYEASQSGVPVVRPMFFEFPEDNRTHLLDEQFFVGSALMVVPVIVPNVMSVQVYLPNENVTWYEFQGGKPVNNGTGGSIITLANWETETLMLLRGGYVITTQAPNLTAESSRLSQHALVIGLECQDTNQCHASGQLYLDLGNEDVTIKIAADQSGLNISNLQAAQFLCAQSGADSTISTVFDEVRVFGLVSTHAQLSIFVNGELSTEAKLEYRAIEQTLQVTGLNTDWCALADDVMIISWT